MKRILTPILAVLAAFLFTGCIGTGIIYTGVKFPSNHPKQEAVQDVGTKSGKACVTSVLGLFAWGDAGVPAAAKAGSVTKVQTVDNSVTAYLGSVYAKLCTVVTGT